LGEVEIVAPSHQPRDRLAPRGSVLERTAEPGGDHGVRELRAAAQAEKHTEPRKRGVGYRPSRWPASEWTTTRGTVEELIALEEPADGKLAPDEGGAQPTSAADAEEAWTKGVDAPEGNLNPGRYCVDQSCASIQYVNIDSCGGLPCQCPNQLTPHAQFSRNHPVNVHLYGCGPYYFVKDLWSSNYGWMRQDALRPC
jgi:hypothetical protein